MTGKNNITGDRLISKPSTNYAEGYDLIFGKKERKNEQDIRATNNRQLISYPVDTTEKETCK